MWLPLSLLAACVETHLGDPDATAVAPVVVEEQFTQSPYPSLDVLFVMDSTGSMAAEQLGFAAAAGDFVAALAVRDAGTAGHRDVGQQRDRPVGIRGAHAAVAAHQRIGLLQ